MRLWKTAVTALLLLAPASALAQFGRANPPSTTSALTAPGGPTVFNTGRMFGPSIDFASFNSNSRDRWYPSFNYGNGFTRDPGAFSGRRDRATAARVMTAQEFRAHQELSNWRPDPGVILVRGQTSGAAGMTYGVFQDGRWVMAQGDLGQINLDVLRAEGALDGNLLANLTDGLMANGRAEARVVVVGVNGNTNVGRLGGSGLGADIAARGRAGVGAEATADGTLALGPNGLRARLGGEAFAGARAGGEIPVGVSILGIRFGATGRGQVSAGAGINGNAYGGIGNGGIRGGCDLGACVGVGGGVGVDLEIDATVAIRNVGNFIDSVNSSGCYRPPEDFRPRIIGPAGNGMVRVSAPNCIGGRCVQLWSEESANRLRDEERNRYENLSAFFANPGTGSQARRYTGTTTTITNAEREALRQWLLSGPRGNAGPAASAGTANALGR